MDKGAWARRRQGPVMGPERSVLTPLCLPDGMVPEGTDAQRTGAGRDQGIGSRKTDYPSMPAGLPADGRPPDRHAGRSSVRASVIVERCAGCGICVQVCPTGAITVNGVASVDGERCVGCGQCLRECPRDALVINDPAARGGVP